MFKKVIYIASDNRSGSTLLDLLLGNHSEVTSVGEIRRLDEWINKPKEKCSCGELIGNCPFWKKVERMFGKPLKNIKTSDDMGRRWLYRNLSKLIVTMVNKKKLLLKLSYFFEFAKNYIGIANNIFRLYEIISIINDTPFIVDSSKVAHYFKLLYLFQPEHIKIIFLYRDGRGVTYSKLQEEKGITVKKAAIRWVYSNIMMQIASFGIPNDKIFKVYYEDLCKNPNEILKSICSFIGIEFQEQMINLNKYGKHNVFGNPMRFDKKSNKIFLDEIWKNQMSQKDLKNFEKIAGWMNKKLGYY